MCVCVGGEGGQRRLVQATIGTKSLQNLDRHTRRGFLLHSVCSCTILCSIIGLSRQPGVFFENIKFQFSVINKFTINLCTVLYVILQNANLREFYGYFKIVRLLDASSDTIHYLSKYRLA